MTNEQPIPHNRSFMEVSIQDDDNHLILLQILTGRRESMEEKVVAVLKTLEWKLDFLSWKKELVILVKMKCEKRNTTPIVKNYC